MARHDTKVDDLLPSGKAIIQAEGDRTQHSSRWWDSSDRVLKADRCVKRREVLGENDSFGYLTLDQV